MVERYRRCNITEQGGNGAEGARTSFVDREHKIALVSAFVSSLGECSDPKGHLSPQDPSWQVKRLLYKSARETEIKHSSSLPPQPWLYPQNRLTVNSKLSGSIPYDTNKRHQTFFSAGHIYARAGFDEESPDSNHRTKVFGPWMIVGDVLLCR